MLFSDRTRWQLRLLFSTVAYVLLRAFREFALAGTELERAKVETIRTRLLKIGARVTVSVRRVRLAMSSAFPLKRLFATVHRRLRQRPPPVAEPRRTGPVNPVQRHTDTHRAPGPHRPRTDRADDGLLPTVRNEGYGWAQQRQV